MNHEEAHPQMNHTSSGQLHGVELIPYFKLAFIKCGIICRC
jgi:hypothetical protein